MNAWITVQCPVCDRALRPMEFRKWVGQPRGGTPRLQYPVHGPYKSRCAGSYQPIPRDADLTLTLEGVESE